MPKATRTMPISGVYAIQNAISGRIYVGSAANVGLRWHTHRHMLRYGKHHSPAMQRSWTKHGPKAFSFRILEIVGSTADLYVREQHWIDALNAACPRRGFNVLPNAGGPRGHKRTAQSIAKQSAATKGRSLTPEHAANVRAALLQRNQTPEMRAAASKRATERNKARRGIKTGPMSDAQKAASSKAHKGIKPAFSAEHRAFLRAKAIERNRVKGQGRLF